MSIVIIKSLPLLLFLTLSVIAFTVVSVLFRAYEEIDKTKKVTVQLLKAYIIECDNQWKVDQNNYYKAYANFKFKNNIQNIDGTVYSEKFREGSKGAISKLIDSYNQSQKSRLELKSLISPSYYSALMYGAKDALSMFGAIASIFYAVNIILLLTGSTFPPVLIVSAVSLGLVSLISFISFRLYCTYRIRSKLETYFQPRVIETSEKEFKHDIPSCTLGWSDCNTDGLTKGELFFQEINEIFRSVCSGVGKSNNLIDFFFSHYKEHSQEGSEELPLLLTISLICLAVIYGGVLALRAFSKGFKSFAKNNKQCTLESKEEPVEKKEYKIEPDILAEKKLACVDNNEILMLEADKVSFSSYSFFNGGNDEEICPEDEARYCHSPKIFSNFNPEGEGDNIAEDSLTI